MNKKGFTLVELMVVISIISILSVIGLTVFGGVQQSARNAKRKADLNSIAVALEINFANQRCTTYSQKSGGKNGGNYCSVISSWFASKGVPTDPVLALPSTGDSGYCIGAYNPTMSGLAPNGASTVPFSDMPVNSNPLSSNTGDARCLSGSSGGYWSIRTTNTPTYYATPYQGTLYWKICANLEPWGSGVYCVTSKRGN